MTKVDVRLQRARRRLGGARVLAIKLRVEPFPTCRMRGLCDECQSRCGATPFEPRPVGTTLECVSLWLATPTRRGQSGRREPVARRRRMRRFEFEATMARPPPCFLTGQGGAYSRSARNRRSPPLPRPEQRRVDGSPFEVSRRASSLGWKVESRLSVPVNVKKGGGRGHTIPEMVVSPLLARPGGGHGRGGGEYALPGLPQTASWPD